MSRLFVICDSLMVSSISDMTDRPVVGRKKTGKGIDEGRSVGSGAENIRGITVDSQSGGGSISRTAVAEKCPRWDVTAWISCMDGDSRVICTGGVEC